MRTLILGLLAILTTSFAATASAQQAEHLPAVTVEIQGRLGGGDLWANSSVAVPGVASGNAADIDLGASLSVRHASSGFGVTLAYTNAFTGFFSTFDLHELDARLSERIAFARQGRFEASLLVEAGATYAFGGGSSSCAFSFSESGSCMVTHVDAALAGGVGALGLQFRYGALLAGLEVDYRHMVSVGGAVASTDEVAGFARVGVAFDL
jgi:hypothetical protein